MAAEVDTTRGTPVGPGTESFPVEGSIPPAVPPNDDPRPLPRHRVGPASEGSSAGRGVLKDFHLEEDQYPWRNVHVGKRRE